MIDPQMSDVITWFIIFELPQTLQNTGKRIMWSLPDPIHLLRTSFLARMSH